MNRSNLQRYKHIKKGNYQNPFFPKRYQASQRPHGKKKWWKIILYSSLIAGLIAAQEHPYMHVSNIDVEGAHLINAQQITETAQTSIRGRHLGVIRKNHMLFIAKKDILRELHAKFAIKNIEIKRIWPNRLSIAIGEREPALRLYYPPNHFSAVDDEGIAVITEVGVWHEEETVDEIKDDIKSDQEQIDEQSSQKENSEIDSVVECSFCDTMQHIPLVYASTTSPASFVVGASLLPTDLVPTLQDIYRRFEGLAIPIEHMTLADTIPGTVEIRVLEGFMVYLDLSKEIHAQIENLSVLLEQKYPSSPRKLQYIDVRYGNRLYYQ